ncbi:MAG: hypothetical protein V4664_02585 [Patescibacteria group bacterium]
MNISKKQQPRFWTLWRNSGAIGNSMPPNTLVVVDTGDYEDLVEGGYTSIYSVQSCNVSRKKGTLEYETRGFPNVPSFSEKPPSPGYLASLPRAGRIRRLHIKTMTRITDEELGELYWRGVNVQILR